MGNDLAAFLCLASWCWLVTGGAAFLLWAFFDDRPGARRRCPRCGYDLQGTPSRRCSECGYRGTTERRLRRTRRQWGQASTGAGLLASAVAAPLLVDLGSAWPKHLPTSALVLGLPVIEDATARAGWKRAALETLLARAGRGAAADGTRHDLAPWQWRRLLRWAMDRVPPGSDTNPPAGPWAEVLATGLGRGAVHRAGLLEPFMERYPAQIVFAVSHRCPPQEPLPFEISAETPFAEPRLRIARVTLDGRPLDWHRAPAGSPVVPGPSRGALPVPPGRPEAQLRFELELTIPGGAAGVGGATDLPLGTRTIVMGFRRDQRLGPIVRVLSEPTRDELVVRPLEPPKLDPGPAPPPPNPRYPEEPYPEELDEELAPREIARLSRGEAMARYALLSRALQRCRLDNATRERLWREWRRVRHRVRELRETEATR